MENVSQGNALVTRFGQDLLVVLVYANKAHAFQVTVNAFLDMKDNFVKSGHVKSAFMEFVLIFHVTVKKDSRESTARFVMIVLIVRIIWNVDLESALKENVNVRKGLLGNFVKLKNALDMEIRMERIVSVIKGFLARTARLVRNAKIIVLFMEFVIWGNAFVNPDMKMMTVV
jgi:hypothetical protein